MARFRAKESTTTRELVSIMCKMNANNLRVVQGDLLDDSDVEVKIVFDRNGKRYKFTCATYKTKLDNFRAAQLTISYLYRALEAYGVDSEENLMDEIMDKFLLGWEATPDDSTLLLGDGSEWYSILNVKPNATKEEIMSAYKSLARVHHPDSGGSHEMFIKLRTAYEKGIEGMN